MTCRAAIGKVVEGERGWGARAKRAEEGDWVVACDEGVAEI